MEYKKTSKNADIFSCLICDFTCCKQSDWDRHMIRPKHIKNIKNAGNYAEKRVCINCDFTCCEQTDWDRHILRPKHIKNEKNAENAEKNAEKRVCLKCDFTCCKQSDWDRHILRPKHINNEKNAENAEKLAIFKCTNCKKIYKYSSGLWKHNKSHCISVEDKSIVNNDANNDVNNDVNNIVNNDVNNIVNNDFKNLVLEIVKSNTELQKQTYDFQKQILEVVCKNNTIIHNSTNNSHNKTFNLQVFLNEECKDAMNLTDFMNSFQLQLEDLEKVGTMGYVDGVSNIILKKLREMDVNKRPMHCSDAKREIMYIKEEDKWEKEGLNNLKLKKAITIIENKNIKLLGAWKEAHPKYMEYDEPDNDIYAHLIIQTMSNCDDFGNKVIKKLVKEVTIEK